MPKVKQTNKSPRRRTGRSNGHAPVPVSVPNPSEEREGIFITERGLRVRINGVSPWLMQNLGTSIRAEWAEVGRTPDPPTYEAELAGGGKETHEHNETTLVTDEDRAAWEKHLAEAEAFQRELMDRSMKTLFIRGVQTPPLEDGSEWMLEQAFMGSRVPINKLERRYFYVRTEIINSPAEGKRLMEAITALSGISREAMRAATETFPGEVEESNGDTSGETGPGGG